MDAWERQEIAAEKEEISKAKLKRRKQFVEKQVEEIAQRHKDDEEGLRKVRRHQPSNLKL